jgi:hypothetical protein
MKKMIFVLAASCAACSAPTQPGERMMSIPVPLHHNIPATMDDGHVVWLCETQPRTYLRDQGNGTWVRTTERDHYISVEACPAIPIS